MCLLITRQLDAKPLQEEWLRDFYKRNNDGFGFMYSINDVLHIDKSLANVEAFIEAWRRHEAEGVAFACHLRMRTHGDTDLENCHPYQVLDAASGNELWMMHNGILSNGNTADTTKSDTWHFVRDYLRPLLDPAVGGDPELVYKPEFKAILGSAIGSSNKFVFMGFDGRVSTINHSSGVSWRGMWLSNSYAWSASSAKDEDSLPTPEKTYAYDSSWRTGMDFDGYEYVGYRGASSGEWLNGAFVRYNSQEWVDHKKGVGVSKEKKLVGSTQLALLEGGKSRKRGTAATLRGQPSTEEVVGEVKVDFVTTTEVFTALRNANMMLAYNEIKFHAMQKFVGHFDTQSVLDLMELVMAGIADEEDLIQCTKDYEFAESILADMWASRREDTVQSTIDKEVTEALKEAEVAEIIRHDPVIAAASEAYNRATSAELDKIFDDAIAKAKDQADAAIEVSGTATQEQQELDMRQTHLSRVASAIESEVLSEDEVETDMHLAESEAAAQLVWQPHEGAE